MNEFLRYGLKEQTGTLISIYEARNGLKCDCICPECKSPLIARQGDKNQWHFAHANNAECVGGRMTALHLLARQIIQEEKLVMLPPFKGRYYKSSEQLIQFDEVFQEQQIPIDDRYRQPDCIGRIIKNEQAHDLLIEIFVTHKVDEKKKNDIKALKLACVEIDLSDLIDTYYTKEIIKERLLNEYNDRVWLNNPVLEENEQREQKCWQRQQEELRIQREKEEAERKLREQIEQERLRQEHEVWLKEEQERRLKDEAERQELQRKEETECQERQRIDEIHWKQKEKLEDYVYHDLLSVKDYWQYYNQLNNEERQFADKEIHSMIRKSITHSYAYYDHRYDSDQNVNKLFQFLRSNNYQFDWQQFETIPELYFNNSFHELNTSLYEKITIILYVKCNYHLPNKEKYINEIEQYIEKTIIESQSNNGDYARCFGNIKMIIICFERIYASSFCSDKDAYMKVYSNRKIIRHLYTIYLGETVGHDFNDDKYFTRNYYQFYEQMAPYYHLYRRMIQCRERIFPNYGLLQNIFHQKEIEKIISDKRIISNHDLDALMPILFPDIPWALQQSLF